ncbi:glycosyltransferase [Vibrio parahaemolyticus]
MIIINMSSAREGGARTIANSYLRYLINNKTKNDYLVLGPKWIESFNFPDNMIYREENHSGLSAILFSSLLILKYWYKFKAKKIVSFSNVNVLINCCERITYFHQFKVFTKVELKSLIYSVLIRLQTKSKFIVQTNLVKTKLAEKFNIPESRILVSWPGIDLPQFDKSYHNENIARLVQIGKTFIVPYYDISSEHKNFDAIFQRGDYFLSRGITVLITSDYHKKYAHKAFKFIGKQSKRDLFYIYENCDAMLFPSKVETIGLPIFEFSTFNKPVFVGNYDYVIELKEKFSSLDNVKVVDFEKSDFSFCQKSKKGNYDYIIGEWGFLSE